MTSENHLGTLFVLSAPSGAGKTSLKDALMERFPRLLYSISATTRPPRKGEVDGEHYHFKSLSEFEEMIAQGGFVEYMKVHDNYYGTPKAPIQEALLHGHSIILDLDVYGKIHFDKAFPEAVGIFIKTPSIEELERRLRFRKSDSEETVQLRMKNAIQEIEFAESKGKYEYVLINDDFEVAFRELINIVSTNSNLRA
jgi:guanylate kinase